MNIKIEQLQALDAVDLFQFELENREFFEKMVPGRGDDYYNFEIFQTRHQALLDEQAQGISYFYLIKELEGAILGRMNLVDIDESQQQKLGHLGYRVGKSHTGKGVANKGLKLFLETMRQQGVGQILAKTTSDNIASQKVLTKNDFKHVETSAEEFEMNGRKLKFYYYQWSN
ncbi:MULTISPECIES: GNAT family N-acetyltransferase [Bacillaceae]|uniref:GNAT family N-acetyltransferase n=1 Tax=Evansella alkalicola TaxID=745819 RepID=A0ABS6JW97_9BACI|nr:MULTISPECIES: GNAT family N-acetyltransferase [Bacillaceae]MBU9722839.1 GNAT family N-acetyltransferase [Bacillus alkalicola]